MATIYEWDFETIDEDGDIVDHHHCATFAEVRKVAGRATEPGRIVLVRDDDIRSTREWAYLRDDGTLPERFEDAYQRPGALVPRRFHTEARAAARTAAEAAEAVRAERAKVDRNE